MSADCRRAQRVTDIMLGGATREGKWKITKVHSYYHKKTKTL